MASLTFSCARIPSYSRLPSPTSAHGFSGSSSTHLALPSHSSFSTFTMKPTTTHLSFALTTDNADAVYGDSCDFPEHIEGIVPNKLDVKHVEGQRETLLHSFSPLLPSLVISALPGATTVSSAFSPFVELVKSWNLPEWLIHWGHPGNMAVVLFAMGGYGTYLGFRIRFSENVVEKSKAKDLHPKLLAGMFFFFALGATGGVTSLLTSDKPIFESPHAITAFMGLSLLTIQTILPALFEDNPGLRNIHMMLGCGIMALFLVHAALGLQLGLA